MQLKDFIGKVVVSTYSGKRFVLREITAPYISTTEEKTTSDGIARSYRWETVNGDPFENGELVFADPELTEPFMEAYQAHCDSQAGYWEAYGYWMHKA